MRSGRPGKSRGTPPLAGRVPAEPVPGPLQARAREGHPELFIEYRIYRAWSYRYSRKGLWCARG